MNLREVWRAQRGSLRPRCFSHNYKRSAHDRRELKADVEGETGHAGLELECSMVYGITWNWCAKSGRSQSNFLWTNILIAHRIYMRS